MANTGLNDAAQPRDDQPAHRIGDESDMTFLDHSIAWQRGEAFEMMVLAGAGGVVLILAVGLWRSAPTALGQALALPLVVVALIFLAAGVLGSLGTTERLAAFSAAFEADPVAFVQAEKARVEAFQRLYTYTIIGAAGAFTGAVMIFVFSEHPLLRAIAVSLAFIGLTGLVVDMFSKERADRYSAAIQSELARTELP